MPTSRRRHVITESDAIARALVAASRRWRNVRRSELLERLIVMGADRIARDEAVADVDRRAAVRHLTELGRHYPAGYVSAPAEGLADLTCGRAEDRLLL